MQPIKYNIDDIPAGMADEALLVQSACNLSGVAHALSQALDKIWKHAQEKGKGMDWVNQHPIVSMYLNQLCHLNCGDVSPNERVSLEFWNLCEKAAERDKKPR